MVRPYYNYEKLEQKHANPPRMNGGMSPVVKRLIIANIIVYAMQLLLGGAFTTLFALSHAGGVLSTIVRLFSYMFLHSRGYILHIVGNMFALYLLGPEVERGMGGRHFFIMYILSGLLGGLGWFLMSDGGGCVGASGAIMGVVASFAVLYPKERLALIFLPMFPIKAWVLAIAFGLVELLLFLGNPNSTVAHGVHLAGGVAGCFYTMAVFWPEWINTRRIAGALRGRSSKPARNGSTSSMPEAELDSILDKISNDGMGSLTARERRLLERASSRKRSRR